MTIGSADMVYSGRKDVRDIGATRCRFNSPLTLAGAGQKLPVMDQADISKWLLGAAAATLFVAATQNAANAQTATPPTATPPAEQIWKAKNLQILPADMSRDQVLGVMKNFSGALGVECSFCHANGADGKLDPASDARKEKASARWMMKMAMNLNKEFGVTDMGTNMKVSCYTCHRGAAHPPIRPAAPDEAPKTEPHKH
jgi:hypothetical protein